MVRTAATGAEMAELADARDLKSLGPKAHPGSIPGLGTNFHGRAEKVEVLLPGDGVFSRTFLGPGGALQVPDRRGVEQSGSSLGS